MIFGLLWRLAPLSLIALAACGGSGDSSQAPPTPSPIPTPTPTPTPVSYVSATDFTTDRDFTGIGLRIARDQSSAGLIDDVRLDPQIPAIGFVFTQATRTYRAFYNTDGIIAVTQVSNLIPPYDEFIGPNSRFQRSPFIVGDLDKPIPLTATYFGYANWSDNNGSGQSDLGTRNVARSILFGARTVAGDFPTSGSSVFAGRGDVRGPTGGNGGSLAITVDYAARTIVGTTTFVPASTGGTGSSTQPVVLNPEPITFSGTFDPATGRLTGIATHGPSRATGTFEGALYGPRGIEMALLFAIQSSGRVQYSGIAGGRN